MHTESWTYRHIQTYIYTCMHTHIHTYTQHTHMHTYTHTYIYIHTHTYTYINTHTCIQPHTCMDTYITFTYIHANTHAHDDWNSISVTQQVWPLSYIYRDRAEHLKLVVSRLSRILRNQNAEYHMFVIEQVSQLTSYFEGEIDFY